MKLFDIVLSLLFVQNTIYLKTTVVSAHRSFHENKNIIPEAGEVGESVGESVGGEKKMNTIRRRNWGSGWVNNGHICISSSQCKSKFCNGGKCRDPMEKFKYSFTFRCYNKNYGKGTTGSKVTFEFYDGNGSSFKKFTMDRIYNNYERLHFKTNADKNFAYIKVEIYGEDSFEIDEAWSGKYEPRSMGMSWKTISKAKYGVQDGGSWCLSTNPNAMKDKGYDVNCFKALYFVHKDVGKASGKKPGAVYSSF